MINDKYQIEKRLGAPVVCETQPGDCLFFHRYLQVTGHRSYVTGHRYLQVLATEIRTEYCEQLL